MVLLFAAAVIVAAGCSGSASGSHADAEQPATTAGTQVIETTPAEFNSDDLAFVTYVTALLRGGQQLSDLVPSRSTDSELAAFAQRRGESVQMQMGVAQALLTQWRDDTEADDGAAQAPTSGVPGPDAVARLSSSSGRDFDLAWLHAVQDLHNHALEAVNGELSKGKNADAVGLARQMAPTEQVVLDEIKQMRIRIGDD